MSGENIAPEAFRAYEDWHAEVAGQEASAQLNAYFGAIAAIGYLKREFPLQQSKLINSNNQVRGIKGIVRESMNRHGEFRQLPSELGRTTRSTAVRAAALIERFNSNVALINLSAVDRTTVFSEIEDIVVLEIQKYLDRQAIRVQIDLNLPGPVIVANILKAAMELKYGGSVAQHLVGAKLAIRFPDQSIENHPYTAADQQTGRRGDFQIGQSVFHVTIGEQPGHFEKCGENLRQGLKPYLLVPEARMNVVRTYFDDYGLTGKAAAQSIESFVGQNMDELGDFQTDGLRNSFAALLAEYNQRVSLSESNRGLMIEIPDNLK